MRFDSFGFLSNIHCTYIFTRYSFFSFHFFYVSIFGSSFFSFSVRRQSLFPGEKRSCSKGKYYDASIRNRCPRVTPYPPPPYRYETLTVPIIAYPQSRSLFPSSFPLHPLSSCSSSSPCFHHRIPDKAVQGL